MYDHQTTYHYIYWKIIVGWFDSDWWPVSIKAKEDKEGGKLYVYNIIHIEMYEKIFKKEGKSIIKLSTIYNVMRKMEKCNNLRLLQNLNKQTNDIHTSDIHISLLLYLYTNASFT